jgi:hypothetical protein
VGEGSASTKERIEAVLPRQRVFVRKAREHHQAQIIGANLDTIRRDRG